MSNPNFTLTIVATNAPTIKQRPSNVAASVNAVKRLAWLSQGKYLLYKQVPVVSNERSFDYDLLQRSDKDADPPFPLMAIFAAMHQNRWH